MIDRIEYKKKRKRVRPNRGGAAVAREKESLSGTVQGQTASDLEERWARAMYRRSQETEYYFQYIIGEKNRPGWKSLDFFIQDGGRYYAVQIDDIEFVHKGTTAQAQDKLNDVIILRGLSDFGIREISHIPGNVLATQESANMAVKELLG